MGQSSQQGRISLHEVLFNDKVEKRNYPNLLVTTGLHDSQVQYFEPAGWVAKLRELKTNKNIILLHTNWTQAMEEHPAGLII